MKKCINIQSGRTMVETLGVLAIIGVLTVTGIAGYTYGMNKFRANEIIDAAYKRAVVVAMQFANGQEKGFTTDFSGESMVAGCTFLDDAGAEIEIDTNGEFYLEVDDVPPKVCSIMQNSVSETSQIRFVDCSTETTGEAKIYYNTDMCQEDGCAYNPDAIEGRREGRNEDCNTWAGYKKSGEYCVRCPKGEKCNCPDDQVANGSGGCTCPDDKPMLCGEKCYANCTGRGMTGERDSGCNCLCQTGSDARTCECPNGYVFSNNSCQRIHCVNDLGKYTCYKNGVKCAYMCNSTDVTGVGNDKTCYGYCDNYCPAGSRWGTHSIQYSGLGCLANNGLYCGTNGNYWYCVNGDTTNNATPCCVSTKANFGTCQYGTCNQEDCTEIKNSDNSSAVYMRISDRYMGCKVTRNGKTAYCAPHGGKWFCSYEITKSDYVSVCAEGTKQQLIDGSAPFTNCFGETRNCTFSGGGYSWNATWDNEIQMCKSGDYACKFSGDCYKKMGDKWEECGRGCTPNNSTLNPDRCSVARGVCNPSFCKNGTTMTVFKSTDNKFSNGYYGGVCLSTRNGGTYAYQPGSWARYVCHYKKDGEDKYKACGFECSESHDCSKCKQWVMKECAPEGECVADGSLIQDCECNNGSASNGHCCPAGTIYVNGGCSKLPEPGPSECYYGASKIYEDVDYKRGDNTVECVCRDSTKCMNTTGNKPKCEVCPEST